MRNSLAVVFAVVVLAQAGCKKEESSLPPAGEGESAAAQDTEVTASKPSASRDLGEPGAREELEDKAKNAIPTVDDGRNAAAKSGVNSGYGAEKTTLADTDTYQLVLSVPAATAGTAARAQLTLTPKSGWKLNKDFPTKLSLTEPSGVKLAKTDQSLPDAVSFDEKKGGIWAVEFTAAAAGEVKFAGRFKFAVCTDATCDPKKEELAFAVAVK